jgi:hypothetical protein
MFHACNAIVSLLSKIVHCILYPFDDEAFRNNVYLALHFFVFASFVFLHLTLMNILTRRMCHQLEHSKKKSCFALIVLNEGADTFIYLYDIHFRFLGYSKQWYFQHLPLPFFNPFKITPLHFQIVIPFPLVGIIYSRVGERLRELRRDTGVIGFGLFSSRVRLDPFLLDFTLF